MSTAAPYRGLPPEIRRTLGDVCTVDQAARILLAFMAAELPYAIHVLDEAIAVAFAAATPEAGLDALVVGLDKVAAATPRELHMLLDARHAIGSSPGLHGSCASDEPCERRRPQQCPREPVRELYRAALREQWSALELRREGMDGLRHYLDDRAVHCGDLIVLQAVQTRWDPFENPYTYPLQRGVVVRYEALRDGNDLAVSLYADVAGHGFTSRYEQWMRCRWPERAP